VSSSSQHITINGHAAEGFGPVVDAFRANFADRGDSGASCAVYLGGRVVVDVWAGESDRGPWARDTRSVVFSVSKGITTICLLMALEDGLLQLDAPVVDYWPEFAANGKAGTTVRHLLAHRAGLLGPAEHLTAEDLAQWTPVTEVLERQAPLWEPGTTYAYHPLTFGWLAGEVLRRATGKRPGQWLAERIAGPLGLSLTFGTLPTESTFAPQGAQLPSVERAATADLDVDLVNRVLGMNGAFDGVRLFDSSNEAGFLGAEMPAANLVANARDLARLYAATIGSVDGVRLLHPDTVHNASIPVSWGAPFLGPDEGNRWATGFMIDSIRRGMAGPGSFGHDGAGGQLAFANPDSAVSFAYTTIRPGGVPDMRAELLSAALRSCL
jgi:CubicO group peptidase (beta-lactamase class C family)